jgi:signal transduction histidine kinase
VTIDQVLVVFFVVLHVLVAVVWATMAALLWQLPGMRGRPRGAVLPLVAMGALVAAGYIVGALLTLTPPPIHLARPGWLRAIYLIGSICFVGGAATFGHSTWRLPVGAPPPGRLRLAGLYGSAAMVLLLDAAAHLPATPAPAVDVLDAGVHEGWVIVVLLLAGWRIARVARAGAWSPDTVFVLRRRDVAVIVCLALAAAVMFALVAGGGWDAHPLSMLTMNVVVGALAVVPFAARALGAVLRVVLTVTAGLLVAGGIYAAAHLMIIPRVPAALVLAVHVGTVALIAVTLVLGQRWLAAAIDQLVLRRTRRRRAEVLALVQGLSPELGRLECSRRVLSALTRVLALRGTAIVLRDGSGCAEGAIDVEALRASWPRDAAADALPRHPYFGHELANSELRDLLVEQRVAGALPITSPQRRWGDLFVSTGLLGMASTEDLALLETVAGQLALLLDGTALLERVVAVERSLAQAEKLAAIGETAARIAHDIRNPVTAARSLAQQLVREPAAPFREELGVILEELDRVERQVATLLRFARREEFRFEQLDLGTLARTTLESLRPRLEAASVSLELDAPAGVVARVDGEKMRQVLTNLIENALDALRAAAGPRRLAVSVTGADGTACLHVSDTGPGVPPEALPRLFEPFFSLKTTGTGLGLAIAKRTVDAHGGRITAASPPGTGLEIRVEVPLARAA